MPNLYRKCCSPIQLALLLALFITSQSALALTLTGTTRVPSLGNANLQVEVGQAGVVNGQTDANGRFSVEIDCVTDPDAFVVIKAFGTGDQSGWGLARATHSCAELLARAAPEDTLEIGPVNILSTSVYSVMAWELQEDGIEVAQPGFSDVEGYRFSADMEASGNVIDVLAGYTAGVIPDLPEGASNTLELVLDRSLLAQYAFDFYGLPEQDLDAWTSAYLSIAMNGPSYRPPEVPSSALTIGTYCSSFFTSCSFFAELNPDGESGTFGLGFISLSAGGEADTLYRNLGPVIFNDALEPPTDNLMAYRISGEDGTALYSTISYPTFEGVQVRQEDVNEFIDIRIADVSEYFMLIASDTRTVSTYPENPEIPNDVRAPRIRFANGVAPGQEFASWPEPQDGEERLLIFVGSPDFPEAPSWSVDRVRFSDDGKALAIRVGRTYNWSLVDGDLLLTAAGFPEHRYRIIGTVLDTEATPYMVTASEAGVVQGARSSVTLMADLPGGFDLADVPGRYAAEFSFATLTRNFPFSNSYFVFDLYADGTGCSGNAPAVDAEISYPRAVTWSLNVRNELVLRRDGSPAGTFQYRSWAPARRSPDVGLYMIEVGPTNGDASFEFNYTGGRLNAYRKLPLVSLGPSCM